MLGFVLRPLRSALGLVDREVTTPLEQTEGEILDAVTAIHRVTDSIEHHVEVIEGLATSVGPLTDSVDRLTATMRDLVALMAPMAAAEHEVQRAEHDVERAEHEVQRAERFLGFRRRKEADEPEAGRAES